MPFDPATLSLGIYSKKKSYTFTQGEKKPSIKEFKCQLTRQ